MNNENLKTHLNKITIREIKILIRQLNLHHKMKLSQNKPELIKDLLKQYHIFIINKIKSIDHIDCKDNVRELQDLYQELNEHCDSDYLDYLFYSLKKFECYLGFVE